MSNLLRRQQIRLYDGMHLDYRLMTRRRNMTQLPWSSPLLFLYAVSGLENICRFADTFARSYASRREVNPVLVNLFRSWCADVARLLRFSWTSSTSNSERYTQFCDCSYSWLTRLARSLVWSWRECLWGWQSPCHLCITHWSKSFRVSPEIKLINQGHKFAGNVLVYRRRESGSIEGIWLGRVFPHHVGFIIDQTIVRGEVPYPLLRGGVRW